MTQDKMSHGQNGTGRNVTRIKCHMKIFLPDKMLQAKMSQERMTPRQNDTGKNVTWTKSRRTKCHRRE